MLSAKTTSPCSYYSFGNFVNEADRSPIEFQFTANFLQMLEKFCSRSRKVAKNACWTLLFVSRGGIGGPLADGSPSTKPIRPCASVVRLCRWRPLHPHPSHRSQSSSPHGSGWHLHPTPPTAPHPSSRRLSDTWNRPAPRQCDSLHFHRTTYSRRAHRSGQSGTSAARVPPLRAAGLRHRC